MSAEENKAIVQRNNDEIWNQQNMDVVDEIIAPNYIRHLPDGRDINGREGIKQEVAAMQTAFPGIKFIFEDMLAEGDKVAGRSVGRGTHKGDFMGIAPTGKEVLLKCIIIFHLSDGQIVEDWMEGDYLTLMHQLGVIPPMGGGE